MSRVDYRGGKAPILTADQLALRLAVPLSLVVNGYAGVHYPTTDRSNPSVGVGIMISDQLPTRLQDLAGYLPVWVHWTQWQDIIVPLMQEKRIPNWRGKIISLGDVLRLAHDVFNSGEVVYEQGTIVGRSAATRAQITSLYRCEEGQYLIALSGIIRGQASAAGF